jgi:hypothetical protein
MLPEVALRQPGAVGMMQGAESFQQKVYRVIARQAGKPLGGVIPKLLSSYIHICGMDPEKAAYHNPKIWILRN